MAIPAVPKLKNGIDRFVMSACKEAGIEYSELMSKNRKKKIADLRHIIACELVTTYMLTTEKAGQQLGIDHASIIHAKKKVKNLLETDFDFKQFYNRIKYHAA
jgi:chromosomal replication initiation ATPase DnaA